MAITGAIFDCDGTLVDSMPMWNSVFPGLLEKRGFSHEDERVREAVLEAEHMSVPNEVVFLRERFGLKESAEELFAEVQAEIREGYRHRVKTYPLVRPFLDGLRELSIPMIVASSTGAPDVAIGLEAHGLKDYFIDIISAEDRNLSKKDPDIYYLALDRLGTDKATTWVFEDAPFGVGTARAAGFPVVCIFNGHDGRDEAWLREHATIFTFEYEGLTPEDLVNWDDGHAHP